VNLARRKVQGTATSSSRCQTSSTARFRPNLTHLYPKGKGSPPSMILEAGRRTPQCYPLLPRRIPPFYHPRAFSASDHATHTSALRLRRIRMSIGSHINLCSLSQRPSPSRSERKIVYMPVPDEVSPPFPPHTHTHTCICTNQSRHVTRKRQRKTTRRDTAPNPCIIEHYIPTLLNHILLFQESSSTNSPAEHHPLPNTKQSLHSLLFRLL